MLVVIIGPWIGLGVKHNKGIRLKLPICRQIICKIIGLNYIYLDSCYAIGSTLNVIKKSFIASHPSTSEAKNQVRIIACTVDFRMFFFPLDPSSLNRCRTGGRQINPAYSRLSTLVPTQLVSPRIKIFISEYQMIRVGR